MHRIKVEFQKGGVFYARLLDSEAPNTCRTILSRLPFEYRFQQSIVSGHAVVCLPPDLTVEPENQRTIGIGAGGISFLVQDKPRNVPDEIYIAYGPYFVSRCSYIDMQQPVNVFAQIDENLDRLREIGSRILLEGAEMVKFSLVED